MSLNIGMYVKRQVEGYMCSGQNPRGTLEEINADFDAFLRERFPTERFTPSVDFSEQDQHYCFDVNISRNGSIAQQDKLYLAITEWVYTHFSHIDGIVLSTYWSG